MNPDELEALALRLAEVLAECDGIGSFNRRGDREIVLGFSSHEAGHAAFELLYELQTLAKDASHDR